MESRIDEPEQQRKIRHRLAVLPHAEEVRGNIAATCRYYGISRPTFYKWLRQYEEFGGEGLRDRSSRPRTCPHQTDAEIVSKIVYLRQHYHFGPAKISARMLAAARPRSGRSPLRRVEPHSTGLCATSPLDIPRTQGTL